MAYTNRAKKQTPKEKVQTISEADEFLYNVGLPFNGRCTVLLKLDVVKNQPIVKLLSVRALRE